LKIRTSFDSRSEAAKGGIAKWLTGPEFKKWLLPLALVLVFQTLVMLGWFQKAENGLYDYWFKLRGAIDPGEQVVILAVDDPSIQRLGPWAWPRSLHAQLLDLLQDARVVCFDLTFAAGQDPDNDIALGEAISRHERVVLSGKFVFHRDENGDNLQSIEIPTQELLVGNPSLGYVNMATDSDNVVRRPSLVDTNMLDMPIPSLALAVVMAAEELSPDDLKLSSGWLEAGKHRIPLNEENRALATFYGPMHTFKTISYADVIEGVIEPEYFKDKIVIIGPETAEDHDTYATPCTASNMVAPGLLPSPGVEIHASMVKSILDDSWYREINPGLNFLFLLGLILLTFAAVSGRGSWIGLTAALIAIAAALGAAYLAWQSHWWLQAVAPVSAIFCTYAGTTAYDFIQSEMERRKTRAVFSRYVSPDVVEELMKDPDRAELGGAKKVVTIMFADIRGFTAYSENKDPVDVITRLNQYLTVMTRTIQKHGGTLDKYLGDGLMAFFGAPIYYEDHGERAIKAAVEIQDTIKELNAEWTEKDGSPPLLVAIGINTGPAVVGNVGSPERMDYTLIGEDVNLASRTEALTKLFETLVLISERSYAVLPEGKIKDSLYYVGEELVKGFTHPIKVYSLSGLDLHFEKSKDKGFK